MHPQLKNLLSWRSLGCKPEWSLRYGDHWKAEDKVMFSRHQPCSGWKLNPKFLLVLLTPWPGCSWAHEHTERCLQCLATQPGVKKEVTKWVQRWQTSLPSRSQESFYCHLFNTFTCAKVPSAAWPLQLSKVSPPDSTAEQAERGLNSITCAFCHFVPSNSENKFSHCGYF